MTISENNKQMISQISTVKKRVYPSRFNSNNKKIAPKNRVETAENKKSNQSSVKTNGWMSEVNGRQRRASAYGSVTFEFLNALTSLSQAMFCKESGFLKINEGLENMIRKYFLTALES